MTASWAFVGFVTFLMGLLWASHLPSVSRIIDCAAVSAASCAMKKIWSAELSKSASERTDPS